MGRPFWAPARCHSSWGSVWGKLPHTRVNCAKSGIRNLGCRWILAGRTPRADARRTVQPPDKHLHRAGQRGLGVHPPGPIISICATHDTLDARTGRREGAPAGPAHRQLLLCELVLGSLMVPPDDAFRRLSVRCGLGPISPTDRHLSSSCVLRRPDAEDRMQGCTHARLHRITRHDTIGCWLHGHVAARKIDLLPAGC